ncbi:uncharacterized protein LOC143292183 [Babylonia areolata]|uniref:uncharacterized protein LOC143292183 n=1 Tax=Babylonia areolata TaxID=304850 RepID=UPI003FCFE30E
MYDVDNEESFDNVTTWLESAMDYRGSISSGVHMVLVGAIRTNTTITSATTTTSTTSATTTTFARPVDHQRAQSLAHHYQIPHFVVDLRTGTADPTPGGGGGGAVGAEAGVKQVMECLVALVVSRALQSQQLSQSITPLNTRLRLLARKTRQSHCCAM